MPRRSVVGLAGTTLHVVNRAAYGQTLFDTLDEYRTYRCLLARVVVRFKIDLFAFALMPNHVHLQIRTRVDRDLSAFMHLLTMIHAHELRRWRGSEGRGAVYQGRFRVSVVDNETYFYRSVRYIERNPVRAGLVKRADEWHSSSASVVSSIDPAERIVIAQWPVPRPSDWSDYINDAEPPADVTRLRRCLHLGRRVVDHVDRRAR